SAAALADMPPDERRSALVELVREHAAAVLGLASGTALRPEHQLTEAGIDSLTAVELRNRLSAATGLRLPATILFDHPSPQALAGALSAQLVPAESGRHEDGLTPAAGAKAAREDGALDRAQLLEALRSVSLDRLRETGVAQSLLHLARADPDPDSAPEVPPRPGGAGIESMSVDDLVNLALAEEESRDTS
ncbi:acyl carrier protein, partial [Streptomonospora algeriensis]